MGSTIYATGKKKKKIIKKNKQIPTRPFWNRLSGPDKKVCMWMRRSVPRRPDPWVFIGCFTKEKPTFYYIIYFFFIFPIVIISSSHQGSAWEKKKKIEWVHGQGKSPVGELLRATRTNTSCSRQWSRALAPVFYFLSSFFPLSFLSLSLSLNILILFSFPLLVFRSSALSLFSLFPFPFFLCIP